MASRIDRLHKEPPTNKDDYRSPAQHDRDRILYSNSFRRLSGVTQVISPIEGIVVHNRLTHSLQVAQVARRLAERFLNIYSDNSDFTEILNDLNPDVVESAALAHDIGHPPFGHVAESEINSALRDHKTEGFEGNAQTFRIVTKLAVRGENHVGLNLTRATLNGVTKYPWTQDASGSKKKWGAFSTEADELKWAREGGKSAEGTMCLEAQIMNWADDVTYAVHDVEDFFRAGIVPIHLLTKKSEERIKFLEDTKERLNLSPTEWDLHEKAFVRIVEALPIDKPYGGTRREQAKIKKNIGSTLITDYLQNVEIQIDKKGFGNLHVEENIKREVKMLKQLNWHYVIESSALKTQQFGYRSIIRRLFEIYADPDPSTISLIPPWIVAELEENPGKDPNRMAADIISSLTDYQAIRLFERLSGRNSGSIRDWH